MSRGSQLWFLRIVKIQLTSSKYWVPVLSLKLELNTSYIGHNYCS